jgi:hydroxypyruvate isomerase
MLFSDMPTAAAMEKIKAAGADAVEFWKAAGKDLGAIAEAGKRLGLPVSVFCSPMMPLVAADSAVKYPEALKELVPACDKLGCRTLIATSGIPQGGLTPSQMHDNLRAAIEAAVPVAEAHDLILVLEPLNASELSYLRSSREAFDLCRMINSPRVKVLYDLYHMQYMEGNLINTIRANLPLIDLPARTAPGQGEINFPNIARFLAGSGYAHYFGLEYRPGPDRDGELKAVISQLKRA